MLIPIVSVTLIGVTIAVAGVFRGRPPVGALLRGYLGAWVGFLLAAVPGALIDVVLGTDIYLALFGHLGAAAGALVAVARGRAVPTRRI